MTLKIRSRSKTLNHFSIINKCYIHADFSSNQTILSGDIDNKHNITFWSKFSVFLSAVTLKIRSRSQSPNQGFSMTECCIHANFGHNPVICSGYIVYVFEVHANINAATDADRIRIKDMHPTLIFFVGVYELPYSLFSIRSTFSRKEDTKHIIFSKTCTFYASCIP